MSDEQSQREKWEQRFGRPLSDDEFREIKQNLIGYFEVLARIDRRLKAEEALAATKGE